MSLCHNDFRPIEWPYHPLPWLPHAPSPFVQNFTSQFLLSIYVFTPAKFFRLVSEQRSAAACQRSHHLHRVGGRERRDPSLHWTRTGTSSWRGANRNNRYQGQCHRQGWNFPQQSGKKVLSWKKLNTVTIQIQTIQILGKTGYFLSSIQIAETRLCLFTSEYRIFLVQYLNGDSNTGLVFKCDFNTQTY